MKSFVWAGEEPEIYFLPISDDILVQTEKQASKSYKWIFGLEHKSGINISNEQEKWLWERFWILNEKWDH